MKRQVLAPLSLSLFALLMIGRVTGTPTARAEDTADLILDRGVFYPVVPREPVAGSLAVRDGRIVYLGPAAGAGALRGDDTEVVDLAGRVVIPGLIDAHSHLAALGAALVQVDLMGAPTFEEVVTRIVRAAEGLAPGEWVFGRGWDQNLWPGKAFPHHRALSAAVPDHPVWVNRVDGHAALLNARAMSELEIPADVVDPSGGRFLRDDAGALTGVLIDNAMDLPRGNLPAPSDEELRRRIRRAADTCVALGLTTVTDMGVGDPTIEAYRALAEAGELPLRAALFLGDFDELLDAWFERGPWIDPQGRVTVRGIKLYADGALGSRGAALIEPYSDDEGNLGLLTATGDHLLEVAKRALETGFQVGIHAIGDRGNLVTLDALEAAFGEPRPEARFRIEHAQVMRLADIERMARLGVIASMQPTHATSDMPWAGDRVGPRRLAGAYAWRKVLDAGGRLAFGSDFPVERPDPRLGLYSALTRQDLDGQPAGGWLPGERLTWPETLQAFTLDAAYSLFLEDEIGSLEIGKRADLVVFEGDPGRLSPTAIPTLAVDLAVVDGEVVYRREESIP
ncbi:MAG: amidohydrolase [Acidobacteriota bacterium]